MSTKKHLSDVLSATDIINLENNKICIISGVGSGKNYFIEHKLAEYGNILYVTSRRAKVNEILAERVCKEKVSWNKLCGDVVITTNHGIELLVKNQKFYAGIRNIAEHFQFVVIDEAHSIYTDATFTDSSFHVWKFVEYIASEYSQIKVILMTGTPEPFPPGLLKDYHVFDKRDECINVQPKSIKIVTQEQAVGIIRNLAEDEKTIYYSNSATKLVSGKHCLYNRLTENESIPFKGIAFCMNDEKAKVLAAGNPSLNIDKNTKNTRNYIAENNMLPENVSVLLTTSTLREGVNLKDTNIKIVFCESHLLSDIQQFVGRVRNGVDVLYIIENASQHCINCDSLKKELQRMTYSMFYGVKAQNEHMVRFITAEDAPRISPHYLLYEYTYEKLSDYHVAGQGNYSLFSMGNAAVRDHIEITEADNKYIRFNHLSGQFDLYTPRIIEYRRTNKLLICEDWKENLKRFAVDNNIAFEDLAIKDKMTEAELIDFLEGVVGKKCMNEKRDELKNTFKRFMQSKTIPQVGTMNDLLLKTKLPYRVEIGIETEARKSTRYILVKRINEHAKLVR